MGFQPMLVGNARVLKPVPLRQAVPRPDGFSINSFSRCIRALELTGFGKKYVAPTCGSDLIVSIDVSPLTTTMGVSGPNRSRSF